MNNIINMGNKTHMEKEYSLRRELSLVRDELKVLKEENEYYKKELQSKEKLIKILYSDIDKLNNEIESIEYIDESEEEEE